VLRGVPPADAGPRDRGGGGGRPRRGDVRRGRPVGARRRRRTRDRRRGVCAAAAWRTQLASRPTLAKLLYALAERVERTVDKAALALYAGSARPSRHDAPLKMAIQRLRVALDGSGRAIVHSDGYRLEAPAGYAFVEPIG
jgi:hypothetical protein